MKFRFLWRWWHRKNLLPDGTLVQGAHEQGYWQLGKTLGMPVLGWELIVRHRSIVAENQAREERRLAGFRPRES